MGQSAVVVVCLVVVHFIVLYAFLLRGSLMFIFAAERLHSIFLVGIDIFLVIDFFQISQEWVTLLDANYLCDFWMRVDASRWRLAFAILRTSIYHRYF